MNSYIKDIFQIDKTELVTLEEEWNQQCIPNANDSKITLIAKEVLTINNFPNLLIKSFLIDNENGSIDNLLITISKVVSDFISRVLDPKYDGNFTSLSNDHELNDRISSLGVNYNELTLQEKLVKASKITISSSVIPDLNFSSYDKLVHAMRYSVLSSGKMLRPALTFLSGLVLKSNIVGLLISAASLECMHTYSLIHDDLPSMDDDNFRRGKLSNHVIFGEAHAVLAGDSLQSLAFKLISENNSISPSQQIQQVNFLATSSGHQGMCLGQSIDMLSCESLYGNIDKYSLSSLAGNSSSKLYDQLVETHLRKTGCLINASVIIGLLNSELYQDTALKSYISKWSYNLGLLFQIKDDLLDVIGKQEYIGKKVGSDQSNNKITFTSFKTVDEIQDLMTKMLEECYLNLNSFRNKLTQYPKEQVYLGFISWLELLTRFVVERKK